MFKSISAAALVGCVLVSTGVVTADIGPPAKLRLLGEPRPAKAGEPFVGQFEITARDAVTLTSLRIRPDLAATVSGQPSTEVLSLDAPLQAALGKGESLIVSFAVIQDPKTPLAVSFEIDGRELVQRFDLSPEHVLAVTEGAPVVPVQAMNAVVRLPPVDFDLDATLDDSGSVGPESRTVRVHGQFLYLRKSACIDTDFDYLIDSCANNAAACSFNGDCAQDLDGADSVTVQLKADVFLGTDPVLREVRTDSAGNFDFTATVSDTPDLYVQFETKNGEVTVESAVWEINYKWRTSNYDDFGGTDLDVGSVRPSQDAGAVHIHNSITRAARWYYGIDYLWTPGVHVRWPTALEGWYDWFETEIWLSGETTWSTDTHVHEWGHHWLEMYTLSYHQYDYCNDTCDAGKWPICGHCRWCDEDQYWAWYEGWAGWIADAFLRSFESGYGKPALYMPVPRISNPADAMFPYRDDYIQLENCETAPPPGGDWRCWASEGRTCTCRPETAEGFLTALLRDIEDGNRRQTFSGAITTPGQTVEHSIYLRQSEEVAVRVVRVRNQGYEGTLDPAFVLFVCPDPANPSQCDDWGWDSDQGSDYPPGPGRNAALEYFTVLGYNDLTPAEDHLWKIAVQGQNGTVGPYTVEVEWLDDHDEDGVTDELSLGPGPIFDIVKTYWPLTPEWFIDSFEQSHPSLINDFWPTATNVGYSIPDNEPPQNPTNVTCESHAIGDPSAKTGIVVSWTPGSDSISGVLGYAFSVSSGAPADPGATVDRLDVATVVVWDVVYPGTYYFNIRAVDRAGNPAAGFVSVGPIIVIPRCGLTLVAPNGGEAWRVGTQRQVTWSCQRSVSTYGWEPVDLDLYKGGVFYRDLGASLTGSWTWEIHRDIVPGSDYRVVITSKDVPADTDISNGNFTIEPDVIENGDGTVSHLNSCLMWLQNAGQAGTTRNWKSAAAWARDLQFAGYTDWRLPTGRDPDGSVCDSGISGGNCTYTELGTLYHRRLITLLSPAPFAIPLQLFWTATTAPGDPSRAMMQDMLDGGQNDASKASFYGAWAVRTIPACVPTFPGIVARIDADGDGFVPGDDCNDSLAGTSPIADEICGDGIDNNCSGSVDEYCNCGDGLLDHGDGTVTELSTCLMWLKDFSLGFSGAAWATAVDWAANFVYAGHDDWRLPMTPLDDATCEYSGSTGYHCTGSEMGHLYYVTLGNQAAQAPGCTGPFLNYGEGWHGQHWSATLDPGNGDYAYVFHFGGTTMAGYQSSYYRFQDQWGSYGASMFPVRLDLACAGDSDGDGHQRATDCDDNDATVYPGADEICDGKDNDCDGATDEGFVVGAACISGAGDCAVDGTSVCSAAGRGTVLVDDLVVGAGGSGPDAFEVVGETLFFRAYDPVRGSELWKTDGTAGGAALVRDIRPGNLDSSLDHLTGAGSTLFFVANDGTTGLELWKSDGTAGGTGLVRDIRAGATGSAPTSLIVVGSTLFFAANDGGSGVELWRSDGTAGGTVRVKDIYAGTGSSSPQDLIAMNGILYFSATDSTHGSELWRSDGTDAGTWLVKDISSGTSILGYFAVFNSVLYFRAYELAAGNELWRSDGTAAGTWLVLDAVPGTVGSNPYQLVATPSLLFYVASDPAHGQELWRSDGTAGGTYMVRDIQPGPNASMAIALTPVGSRIMLLANDGETGREPWVSDGTPAGTWLVRDVAPGPGGNDPYCMLGVGDVLYFCGDDAIHGVEFWTSDGSYSGTSLVRDIRPGASSFPRSPVVFRGLVYFGANDGTLGTELWSSDGTADGTRCDALPGAPTTEVCDGQDNDCNGVPDDAVIGAPTWYVDGDLDGYGAGAGFAACIAPSGYVTDGTDCNDADPSVHPASLETGCDGIDNDCSSATPDLLDADGDALACDADCNDAMASCTTSCIDFDGNGIADCAELLDDADQDGIFANRDCDDHDPSIATCNTPASNAPVIVNAGSVSVTFPNITSPGDTTVTVESCDQSQLEGMSPICPGAPCVRVETSAAFDGMVQVCLTFAASGCADPCSLRMVECDGTPRRCRLLAPGPDDDACNGTVCALTQDFSYFGAGLPTDGDGDGTPDLADNCPAVVNWFQTDDDKDGYGNECDCAAGDALAYPGAVEFCDGTDNDCDGVADDACVGACPASGTSAADIPVSSDPAGSYAASVAWTGTEYGVAWHDDRQGEGNWEIYFARLDASGRRVDPEIRVTAAAGVSSYPSVVWTGTEYGVAWRDNRDGNEEIYFVRLNAAGLRLGTERRITNAAGASAWPSLVWNGEEYGLAWYDERDGNREIYFTRLHASGNKIRSEVRITNNAALSQQPALDWSGKEWGIAWHDNRFGNTEILFARLDAAGTKLGGDLRITNSAGASENVALVSNGAIHGMAWHDYRDGVWEIYFARVDLGGAKLGADLRLTNNASTSGWPDVAWNGSEFGVFWHDQRDGVWELYERSVDTRGVPTSPETRLTFEGDGSYQPSVVWSGNGYALAWHDDRKGNFEILFNLVYCCTDNDSDGYTRCESDCDDARASVYPGAAEICDYLDNDCDGSVDDGFATPGLTSGLQIDADRATLTWAATPEADRYDVIYGSLADLRGGNLAAAACLENDSIDASATQAQDPAPGQGQYFIVRAQRECRLGSFDSGGAGQSTSRDPAAQSICHQWDAENVALETARVESTSVGRHRAGAGGSQLRRSPLPGRRG